MQPGDIVESVDMEMSDDETDNKPKSRVLVDLRSQDRDMRIGALSSSSSHMDMDMRMIPLSSGQISGPRGSQLIQDVHLMRSAPPPPPPPQFQSSFRQEQSEFSHRNQAIDFHTNQPNFHQNRPPPNFLPNQQNFHPNQQEFHQLQSSQQDFHQLQQDFEYHEHNMRPKQDFLKEAAPGRGRYSQSTDHQRDNTSFHRNDRNRSNNRGFPRNRRDRYSDDHNMKQRSLANSRKPRSQDQQHHQSSPEILPNSRPLLLQPPDTVIILDEEGMPIGMPEFGQDNNTSMTELDHDSDNCQNSSIPCVGRTSHDTSSSHDSERNQQSQQQKQQSYSHGPDHDQQTLSSTESDDQPSSTPMNQVTVIPITDNVGSDLQQQNQYLPISEYEEHVESTEHSTGGSTEKPNAIDNELTDGGQQEENFTENEQLDDLINPPASGNELKRSNGTFEQGHEEESPTKKRTLLPNGPQMPAIDSTQGPNGSSSYVIGASTVEMHPSTAPIYEYDTPNFRPRLGTPFPWRGGPPLRGGRGGFRGGPLPPRGPWMDRGPRGPVAGNFSSRGLKRGAGQFRGGGGFRGRGRGSNW